MNIKKGLEVLLQSGKKIAIGLAGTTALLLGIGRNAIAEGDLAIQNYVSNKYNNYVYVVQRPKSLYPGISIDFDPYETSFGEEDIYNNNSGASRLRTDDGIGVWQDYRPEVTTTYNIELLYNGSISVGSSKPNYLLFTFPDSESIFEGFNLTFQNFDSSWNLLGEYNLNSKLNNPEHSWRLDLNPVPGKIGAYTTDVPYGYGLINVTAVPEPSTIAALTGVGVIGAGLGIRALRNRRKRRGQEEGEGLEGIADGISELSEEERQGLIDAAIDFGRFGSESYIAMAPQIGYEPTVIYSDKPKLKSIAAPVKLSIPVVAKPLITKPITSEKPKSVPVPSWADPNQDEDFDYGTDGIQGLF